VLVSNGQGHADLGRLDFSNDQKSKSRLNSLTLASQPKEVGYSADSDPFHVQLNPARLADPE
jgi:hypothetical protein